MKTYSSEGCADAMVDAGQAAEASNYIDNSIIEQQRDTIDRLNDRIGRLLIAMERISDDYGLALARDALKSDKEIAALTNGDGG